MGAALFYLFYLSTWLMAQLPMRLIYCLSDAMRVLAHRVVRYRRAVVRANLRNAFPGRPPHQLLAIEREYYRHLCDVLVEDMLLLHASPRRVERLVEFTNLELLERLYAQGKSVIIALGHYGNWELLSLSALYTKHKAIGVYKPLVNKRFENFITRARERFGAIAVPMNDAFRTFSRMHGQGELSMMCLIIDQAPPVSKHPYWTTFLHQDTSVFLGVEKIAVKMNQPVVFCSMRKVARGRYRVSLTLLTDNPRSHAPHAITEMHVRALEGLIEEAPAYWLWSHRRWKRRRPAGEGAPPPPGSRPPTA